MSRKRKRKQEAPHPTIFVFQGAIRHFSDGSMLELHTQVTAEEWNEIVHDTIRYKIFLECLKETAFPILKEQWTKEDEWFRLQLKVAEDRIKNIDPLLVISIKQDKIKQAFEDKMKTNAAEVVSQIKMIHQLDMPIDNTHISVSEI